MAVGASSPWATWSSPAPSIMPSDMGFLVPKAKKPPVPQAPATAAAAPQDGWAARMQADRDTTPDVEPPRFRDFNTRPKFLERATRDRIDAYRASQEAVLADAAQREADIRSRYSLTESPEERRAIASQLSALGAQLDRALANIDASFSVAGAYTQQAGKDAQKAFRQSAAQSGQDIANLSEGTSGGFAERLADRAAEGVTLGNNAGGQLSAFGAQLAAMAAQAQAGYGAEARLSENELAAAAQAQHAANVARRIADDRARMNAELSGVADMRSNAILSTADAIADQRFDLGVARQDRFDDARARWADAMTTFGANAGAQQAAEQRSAAFNVAMQSPRLQSLPEWVQVPSGEIDELTGQPIPVSVPARENIGSLVATALDTPDEVQWRQVFNTWLNGSREAQQLAKMYPWLTSEGIWQLAEGR